MCDEERLVKIKKEKVTINKKIEKLETQIEQAEENTPENKLLALNEQLDDLKDERNNIIKQLKKKPKTGAHYGDPYTDVKF